MTRPNTSTAPRSTRRPQVDPLVPTVAIDRYLGRVHVATPPAEVAAAIEAQIATRTDPRWTPTIARQTVRYAVWRHRENFRQYAAVMGGHP